MKGMGPETKEEGKARPGAEANNPEARGLKEILSEKERKTSRVWSRISKGGTEEKKDKEKLVSKVWIAEK